MKQDNLNRIRGILSARLGAEIPKFAYGNKIYKKLPNGEEVFSEDGGTSWLYVKKPNEYYELTQNEEFMNIPEYDEATRDMNILREKSQMKIYGGLLLTPTTSVEEAANSIKNTYEATKQLKELSEAFKNLLLQSTAQLPKSLNDEEKAKLESIVKNTPKKDYSNSEIKLAGMTPEQLQQKRDTVAAIGQASVNAITTMGNIFGAKQATTDSNLTKGLDAGFDTTADVVSLFGPVGLAIGGAMKIAGAAGDIIQGITGGNDQMTTADKVLSSSWLSWTPISAVNDLFGKESDAFATDVEALETVGSSYGGTASDISEAATNAGKKYGLFSSNARKRANYAAKQVATKQGLMSGIADTARDQRLAVQSMGEQAGLAYSMMTDGGYDLKYTYAAKHGGLLEWNPVIELEWQPQVELNWELPTFKEGGSVEFVEELEWIPEFKDGGKTEESDVPEIEETTQKNVIPEGALHKNKHHMEHAEGLTKKGIPVVDEDGEQQAEIEHSEIIFTLEVTKKLEEYYEIFYSEESTNKEKEQAALEAGKLLVYQILENTEDRTGLIESCKKGGSLTLKKSTDDLIEEVLEWMPTVVVVETEEVPKKESKKEESEVSKKDTKDEIKEMIKEVLIELLVK